VSSTATASLQTGKSPDNGTAGGWAETSAYFDPTDKVTITATGSGTTEGVATSPTGKAGDCSNTNRFSNSFCYLALIGKWGVGGTPFLVGASYSGSPTDAPLYLRVNRAAYEGAGISYAGTLSVTITTRSDPCPGFTPSAIGDPIVYTDGKEPPKPLPGPGAALKLILRAAGIVASPTCSCNARAAQMDAWGTWGCLKRLPEISGWLKEEAEKRGLWFFLPAGVVLILAAISLAALKRAFRGNSK
jgi:hypothetical protein